MKAHLTKKLIVLPWVFNAFKSDFGKGEFDSLHWIASFSSGKKKEEILLLFDDPQAKIVFDEGALLLATESPSLLIEPMDAGTFDSSGKSPFLLLHEQYQEQLSRVMELPREPANSPTASVLAPSTIFTHLFSNNLFLDGQKVVSELEDLDTKRIPTISDSWDRDHNTDPSSAAASNSAATGAGASANANVKVKKMMGSFFSILADSATLKSKTSAGLKLFGYGTSAPTPPPGKAVDAKDLPGSQSTNKSSS